MFVCGHLATAGVWRIDASLRFHEGLTARPGDALHEQGRAALVEAIVREGIRGRALGATSVRTRMDVAGVVREFGVATAALVN